MHHFSDVLLQNSEYTSYNGRFSRRWDNNCALCKNEIITLEWKERKRLPTKEGHVWMRQENPECVCVCHCNLCAVSISLNSGKCTYHPWSTRMMDIIHLCPSVHPIHLHLNQTHAFLCYTAKLFFPFKNAYSKDSWRRLRCLIRTAILLRVLMLCGVLFI